MYELADVVVDKVCIACSSYSCTKNMLCQTVIYLKICTSFYHSWDEMMIDEIDLLW